MSLIGCIRSIFKSQYKEQNDILYLSDDNAEKPLTKKTENQVVSDAKKNTFEVISPSIPIETSNKIISKTSTSFDIPDFLSHRYITEYDTAELQELFAQNKIECFGELTVEMLRSFLKYSYADAIYVIELLGLYGIKFNTEKLKQFSNPPTSDYRILKFDRDSSDISINENSLYEIEKIKLKRYLFDMKLSTTFLLDGIKLDVLLFNLGFAEEILHDLLDLKFYSQNELQSIYYREVNDENQNTVSNNEVHSDDNSQLLLDFPENNNSTLIDDGKKQNDTGLMLRRLTVYNAQKENYSQLDCFEEYFKSQKGIISIKDVEEHFTSLGWNDLLLANYLGISTNVFKLTNGYFHKDNITCNMEKLNHIMEKVRIKIEECGYVSLEVIKNKNFVEWLGVFENEDLDAKSMASIIRAFYPNCPYKVCSNGLISYGSKLKPYEALYQWMTQMCKKNQYVATAQIMSFCEDNKFHRYKTKNQIKNKIVEIGDDCWVTYDYLGINKEIEDTLICKIGEVFLETMKPYISIETLLSLIELPQLNNEKWNEYIVRSIIENRGSLVLYNLVIVNPYQTDFITLDRIVANEIFNFAKTWYMDAEKLERLLRRNKILGKNETFAHKTIQNILFHANSYIELRDKNKNACIKADFRKVFQ